MYTYIVYLINNNNYTINYIVNLRIQNVISKEWNIYIL
jgi:hypothetical protein